MSKAWMIILVLALSMCSAPSRVGSRTPVGLPPPPSREQVDQVLAKVGEVPQGPESYTLKCISDRICWAGNYLNQWRTDDGGGHWRIIFSSKSDLDHIEGFDYLDAEVAWIITFEYLYKTEDGGQTWTEQSDPLPGEPKGQLRTITFLKGGRIGWAGGGIYRAPTRNEQKFGVPTKWRDQNSGLVLGQAISYTEDGGKTWVRQAIPSDEGTIYSITMMDEQRGIVLGSTGGHVTTDAGKRWQSFVFGSSCTARGYGDGYDASLLGFYNLGSEAAWLTFDDGRISKTTDGGHTWCDVIGPNTVKFDFYDNYFREIHFTGTLHGWGLGANGFLYETKDGGTTWKKVTIGRFDDMFFLGDETGWLISKAGLFRIGS